ncbi:MAG: 50S ribosomal protein L17 [Chitinophagaceae bacterium]|jgi:large subunit ribosomal protein L17|nr:50S ribosomal protein L17 [Chitinophagaceae bacterium]
MRHGDKINNLGRKKAHREMLLANLASQLIVHKRLVTTLAKAKALRTYVEPLITKTKKNENELQISHQHRVVFSYLQDKYAVKELFTVVAPKIASRPGGYTRIIKLGTRPGDNAEKAMIELVDFNAVYKHVEGGEATEARRTRRSRSKKPVVANTANEGIQEAEVVDVTTEPATEVTNATGNVADVTDAPAPTPEEKNNTTEEKAAE